MIRPMQETDLPIKGTYIGFAHINFGLVYKLYFYHLDNNKFAFRMISSDTGDYTYSILDEHILQIAAESRKVSFGCHENVFIIEVNSLEQLKRTVKGIHTVEGIHTIVNMWAT